RQTMHLDTVLSFCDRDLVVIFPEVVNSIHSFSLRPGDTSEHIEVSQEERPFLEVLRQAMGLKNLRVLETGGNTYEIEQEQWNDSNNLLAISPGTVISYNRNVYTNTLLRKAGVEVITIPSSELGR